MTLFVLPALILLICPPLWYQDHGFWLKNLPIMALVLVQMVLAEER